MADRPESVIDVAAQLMATNPGAGERVLREHRRRADGRCTACTPLTWWPCVMVSIARRAEALPRSARPSPD